MDVEAAVIRNEAHPVAGSVAAIVSTTAGDGASVRPICGSALMAPSWLLASGGVQVEGNARAIFTATIIVMVERSASRNGSGQAQVKKKRVR